MSRESMFIQKQEDSELKIRYVLLSKDNAKIQAKIFSKLSASRTKSDVEILSIVSEAGAIELDGCIQIDKNIV
jgi:hypothetical protein